MTGPALDRPGTERAGVGEPIVPVETRIVGGFRTAQAGAVAPACLRCGSLDAMRLEKARAEANTCYRCRDCGHIYSPVGG